MLRNFFLKKTFFSLGNALLNQHVTTATWLQWSQVAPWRSCTEASDVLESAADVSATGWSVLGFSLSLVLKGTCNRKIRDFLLDFLF